MKLSLKSGKTITRLLNNRGRSRRMLSRWFQSQQEKYLNAVLSGEKKLRLSSHVSKIPVSLATWYPRTRSAPLVILSMLQQKVRPSEVNVWLSPEDKYIIKGRMRDFFKERGVRFRVTENIRSHNKWLPMLESGQDDAFVILDDDTIYPSDWFGKLLKAHEKHPEIVVAHRCHKMKLTRDGVLTPYTEWDKGVYFNDETSHHMFPVGCGGYIVLPHAFPPEFRDRNLINKICPDNDDIWMKSACLYSGIKCRKTKYDFPALDYPGTTKSGLAQTNVDQGENDKQIKQVFDYFDLKIEI